MKKTIIIILVLIIISLAGCNKTESQDTLKDFEVGPVPDQLELNCNVERIDILDKLPFDYRRSEFNGRYYVYLDLEGVNLFDVDTKKIENIAKVPSTVVETILVMSENNVLWMNIDYMNLGSPQSYQINIYNLEDRSIKKILERSDWTEGPFISSDGLKIGWVELSEKNIFGEIHIVDLGPDHKYETADDHDPLVIPPQNKQIINYGLRLGEDYLTFSNCYIALDYLTKEKATTITGIGKCTPIYDNKFIAYDSTRVRLFDIDSKEETLIDRDIYIGDVIFNDNKIIWTKIRDGKYFDIYSYDITNKQKERLTTNSYLNPIFVVEFKNNNLLIVEKSGDEEYLYLAKC